MADETGLAEADEMTEEELVASMPSGEATDPGLPDQTPVAVV